MNPVTWLGGVDKYEFVGEVCAQEVDDTMPKSSKAKSHELGVYRGRPTRRPFGLRTQIDAFNMILQTPAVSIHMVLVTEMKTLVANLVKRASVVVVVHVRSKTIAMKHHTGVSITQLYVAVARI
jgi:hypothetical protein